MAKSGPGLMLIIGKGKPAMPPTKGGPGAAKKKSPKSPFPPAKAGKSPMKGGSKKVPPFMKPGFPPNGM